LAVSEQTVTDVPDRDRYELRLGDELVGFAQYRLDGGSLAIPHTEIDPNYSGRGLGSSLVRTVLDDARSRELTVVPYCPFVRDYIAGHPEYVPLVPESRRDDFGLA
jgi:predicted GNAT family acetyltransferase